MIGMVTALLLATVMTGAAMAQLSGEIDKKMDRKLLEQAEKIELVRVKGQLSYVEYKKKEPAPDCYLPPLPSYSITRPTVAPFGEGAESGGNCRRTGNSHCGLLMDLARGGQFLNILPFQNVTIAATVSGTWEVALADRNLSLVGENAPLGVLPASGPVVFDLASLLPKLDLRRIKYLVFVLKSGEGTLQLQEVSFTRAELHPPASANGIWLWDSRKVPGREAQVVNDLTARGLKRVYLQVGNDLESLLPFLQQARKAGIQVFALDGSPDHVLKPSPLLDRVRAVLAFNRNHREYPFAGFQLDVEPYTRKDFNLRRDFYSQRYLELLGSIRELCGDDLKISAVIPFWYDTVPFGKSDLAGQVTTLVDEVVVMSYRTNYRTIMEIATDELAYGEKLGKPVYLGLEITPLDDEEHTVLLRRKGAKKGTNQDWQETGAYRVKGSDLSFYGRMAELPAIMAGKPPFSSFAGWVIHSYEGLEK